MNINRIVVAALAGLALTGSASAHTATTTRVVKKTHTVDNGGPQRGASSFTEAQARGHIEHAGFTNVSTLKKDDGGIWRGTARKGNRTVKVALDFKGNVSTGR